MGNRLSKIYTRTGDKGVTGLGDGSRVDKDSLRVEAYGTVDELNSAVGLVLAATLPDRVRQCLVRVQHELFDLGGELCMPGTLLIPDAYIDALEHDLDHFNDDLPPLKDFILPGGSESAARCHLARTIARRAERRVVNLAHEQAVNDASIRYLNRLSDMLFVIARVLARGEGERKSCGCTEINAETPDQLCRGVIGVLHHVGPWLRAADGEPGLVQGDSFGRHGARV